MTLAQGSSCLYPGAHRGRHGEQVTSKGHAAREAGTSRLLEHAPGFGGLDPGRARDTRPVSSPQGFRVGLQSTPGRL